MGKSIIPAADTSNYLVTTDSDIIELIDDNLEGDELSAFDLARVGNPQGKTGAFTIPTPGGDDIVKDVEGVIIFHKNKRAYWHDAYSGSKDRPECSSLDAKTGTGEPGGSCKSCPFAQFGTKLNKDNELTRGQACQARKHMFMVREGDLFPLFFSLPPTAVKSMKVYLTGLISSGLRYHRVVTKITLEKSVNADGIDYFTPRFEMVGTLDDEAVASLVGYRDTVIPWLQEIAVESGEVFDAEEPDFS